ncbi:DUF4123 domain-containing protein [Rhizobium sp. 9T]|uniref:DUF4123 domain-containing protein n=1 Tax=Rhizobium croatiense TaxID=2867516 RepID=UPI001C9336FD|nr:DUF4123 domain-containing protein [Rhizobium croatiense]MBY4611378.1 DUF4123 domain-containing protein [Rhizobium croatiense]
MPAADVEVVHAVCKDVMMEATPVIDLPDVAEAARVLRQTVDEMSGPVIAVLDGGGFDDLPAALASEAISCRSLFLEGVPADFRRAGPWIAEISSTSIRSHVEWLDTHHNCAVYWSCSAGSSALYRHLRTLNEVMIPREGVDGKQQGGAEKQRFERVLFRHWDPNVLGAVLPILTRSQFARFLGPAAAVAFNGPDYGGVRRARKAGNMPDAAIGPLRLEPDQIERLKAAMLHSSRLRIARFLKKNTPPHFSGVNDDFVWGAALASERTADELGIRSERGRARWAYVMVMSDGKAADLPEVRSFIQEKGATPDARVKELIGHTVDALRSGNAFDGAAS